MTQPQQQMPRQPQQDYSPIQNKLYNAVIQNHPEQIPGLVAEGADPNAIYNDNRHYLQLAISMGNTDVFMALVECGADIHSTDGFDDKITPLYYAASLGNIRALEVLIEGGADIDLKCGADQPTSPVHIAVINGKADCVKMLAENGADLSEHDEQGKTLMHSAALNGDVATIAALAEHGVSLNTRDEDGNTPSHVAGTFDLLQAVWMFKALGADMTLKNKHGRAAGDNLKGEPKHELVLEKMSETHANRIKHIRSQLPHRPKPAL